MFTTSYILARLMTIPGILLGFVLHEFAHAKMADSLGDPTPRMQGRLTLDPRAHIDIIGFIMILIINFGWAKPVMTNRKYYKHPRRDDILVSIAGPFMNLLIGIVFLLSIRIIDVLNFTNNQNLIYNIDSIFAATAYINILLFVLNLMPFPFFDGYHIITNLFNTWRYRFFDILERYGMFIFIIFAFSGAFGMVITPLVNIIYDSLKNLISYI